MVDYGTPLGVDELLRLGGMAHAYTNERMGRANALRGLLRLGPISAPQTGIDAGLRSVSTARDDEITNAIFADIVAETTPSAIEGSEALPVISQKQFEQVFRKKYPQYVDRYLSDTLKLWSSYRGQEQKEQERTEDINKASAERVAARDFDEFQKEWNASDQTNATFNKLVTKYISKTSKPGRDPAAVAYLKSLITASYGTRGERASEVERKDKLAVDDATQYVVDMTIQGIESGMSVEGAYNNAVSVVRSGDFAGKFNDVEAVRRLKARGHDVVPPTTEWVFDLDEQKPVKISERKRRQNPDKYGPPLSSVNGKLSETFFIAGMEMLMADIANPEQVNPMTFDILYYYQLNGLSKLREEDVAVMGRWSAAAQALKSAAKPATSGELDALRDYLDRNRDDDDTDVQRGG